MNHLSGTVWLKNILFTARVLVRAPLFSATVILTAATGIGGLSAIYCFVYFLLLRPLPFPAQEQLVQLWIKNVRRNVPRANVALADVLDWRAQTRTFRNITAYYATFVNFTGHGEPLRLSALKVDDAFTEVLGLAPRLGRAIGAEDNEPGAERVTLLTYPFWKRQFGGDTSLVGTKIYLDGRTYVIIGVLPPEFELPLKAQLLIPLAPREEMLFNRDDTYLWAIGRLFPQHSIGVAQEEMNVIAQRLEKQYPATNYDRGIALFPLHGELARRVKPAIVLLAWAMISVYLICVANIANILLSRGLSRQKEIGIRFSLGATRFQVLNLLLTENLLMALAAGVLGFLISKFCVNGLLALAPSNVPRLTEVGVSWAIVVFTLGLSLLTGLLAGIIPALQSSRPDIAGHASEAARGNTASLGRRFISDMLIVVEVALAFVLVVSAFLLIGSYSKLQHIELGFDPFRLWYADFSLPAERYPTAREQELFVKKSLQTFENMSGVSVAALYSLPFIGRAIGVGFEVDGLVNRDGLAPIALLNPCTSKYFETVKIPIVRGGRFTDRESPDGGYVAIINETLVKRHFGTKDPIGSRIRIEGHSNRWFEVIGVAADNLQFSPARTADSQIYIPFVQMPMEQVSLAFKIQDESPSRIAALKEVLKTLDGQLPVSIDSMQRLISRALEQQKFQTHILGALAGIGVFLAIIGVYGVFSYTTERRKQEFAIRMALGSTRAGIVGLVLKRGAALAGLSLAIGILLTFATRSALATFLFGLTEHSVTTYVGAIAATLLIALVATAFPAARATRIQLNRLLTLN